MFLPMAALPPIKVRIRNGDGLYLAGDPSQWSFSADRSRALVFDYVRHQIGEQLEEIRQMRGVALEAEPVEPEEVYEICEGCHQFATAFAMFFDGNRFFCLDCLTKASATRATTSPTSMSTTQVVAGNLPH